MELENLIRENQYKSTQTYVRRQSLEIDKQRIQLEIVKIEQEMLMLDGEMRILERLQNAQ